VGPVTWSWYYGGQQSSSSRRGAGRVRCSPAGSGGMEQVQHLPADLEVSPGADDDSADRTARGADVCVHGRGPVMASDVC